MRFISLRWKISGILFLSNLLIGLFIVIFMNVQVKKNLGSELIEKGRIIAENLAQFSTEQIVEEDRVGLRQLVSNAVSFESVEYIVIQKSDLSVLADTYNGQVPPEVLEVKPSASDQKNAPVLINIATSTSAIYDIWAPVEEGYLGYVRVGIRQDYVKQKVFDTAWRVVTVIIVTIIVAWVLVMLLISHRVITPLMYLVSRADEISQGKLQEAIDLKRNDEIGLLGQALERLRESVKMALDRLKKQQKMRM